jgi:hypothetical protein
LVGTVRPWSLQAPGLGGPRHLETLRLNRDLLDVGLGRLALHTRHAAEITRYLVAPALSLADLAAYVFVVAGLGRATPALTTLGLVEGDLVCAVPPAPALLRHLARRSGIELSEQGHRKLERAPATSRGVIGRQIGGLIGSVLERDRSFNAPGGAERPPRPIRPTIPGIVRDSSDSPTPPPTPPEPGGGQQKLRKHRTGSPKPTAAPVPETDATRLLRAIDVRPAQQIELAGLPGTIVEYAIADGRTRQGIRDLASWVVYLLRQRRDHGWMPPPPMPRADAPETLGAYFAQLAAEHAAGRESEQAHEHPHVERSPKVVSTPARPAPPVEAVQPPSLAELWQTTLAGLRLRLPREVYQACVRQASLIGYADGVATIGVSDGRTKDTLVSGYSGALRLALSDALGHDVAVRVVMHMPARTGERDV